MIACTVVARNYLAQAKVLARSFERFHPQHRFVVLVLDGDFAEYDSSGMDTVTPHDVMDKAVFGEMATCYTILELATAVKPFLLSYLLGLDEVAMYLDPDIEVFAPLDDIAQKAMEHGIVLTPHTLDPLPRDGLVPTEYGLMKAGVFNLGFVTVSRSARDFVSWWEERLRTDCIVAPDAGLFVDQKWVVWVPCYWDHHVLRDRGCNVAYWNAHERPITKQGDQFFAGGDPLRFFHFSGFDPRHPEQVSKHAPERARVTMTSPMDELFASYAQQLTANDFLTSAQAPYGLAESSNGGELLPSARQLYRRGIIRADSEGQSRPPNAFSDPVGFETWMDGAEKTGVEIPRGREVFSLMRDVPEDLLRIAMGVYSNKRLRPVAIWGVRTMAAVTRPFRR